MTEESSRRSLCFLFCVSNGVQSMSPSVPGLVQSSLNLGQVRTEADSLRARIMVRSGVNSLRDETARRVFALEARCTGLYDLCRRGFGTEKGPNEYTAGPVRKH